MLYWGNAVTDIGNVKKVNQDSLMLKIAEIDAGMVCFAVICDGLGGLEKGEVASANVLRAFEQWFIEKILKIGKLQTKDVVKRAWEELLSLYNEKLKSYGQKNGIRLGTTVTAALFQGDTYYVIHIGDCRMYQMKQSITQITKDHTLLELEKDQGVITGEFGEKNKCNILFQCVGASDEIAPDFLEGRVEENETFLLCTDGFRHELTSEEIFEWCAPSRVSTAKNIKDNLEYLLEVNKVRGERDNISAILIKTGN